jgi:hypothetical protein
VSPDILAMSDAVATRRCGAAAASSEARSRALIVCRRRTCSTRMHKLGRYGATVRATPAQGSQA